MASTNAMSSLQEHHEHGPQYEQLPRAQYDEGLPGAARHPKALGLEHPAAFQLRSGSNRAAWIACEWESPVCGTHLVIWTPLCMSSDPTGRATAKQLISARLRHPRRSGSEIGHGWALKLLAAWWAAHAPSMPMSQFCEPESDRDAHVSPAQPVHRRSQTIRGLARAPDVFAVVICPKPAKCTTTGVCIERPMPQRGIRRWNARVACTPMLGNGSSIRAKELIQARDFVSSVDRLTLTRPSLSNTARSTLP